ncbi:hypothetical protein SAMN04488028_101955 [Reichenbachiella agariperforans]|uniref:Uncharacterized protein n=1 Tax=Reichenbachiella agariperforans TaxID=156994 RepID=A0A1M6LGL8_REIAG|nr:hypothetical protein [Reichenbachiella agariperforans]SHJ70363.1 hypothetical protein SAMN04488028_101955 [Reichenbachiella agariperforans]
MTRIYNISDARLLQHTGVLLETIKTDLPQFTAFDPDLDEALITELSGLYSETLEEGGDDVARGKVGEKTQSLLDEMKRADKATKSLRYWVKKTFEKDPASLKRFQLVKYWKVRDRQPELVVYMNTLAAVVAELRAPLEAAKVPVDLLDSVKSIADALSAADISQESSKGGRSAATQARVTRLNAIYDTDRKINNAAEFIYDDDPAKRERYRIPGNAKPSTEDEEPEGEG